MPAAQEVAIEKLGIIAGGGRLPALVAESCEKKGIACFVIGFEGQTDEAFMKGRPHLRTSLGHVGKVIKTLKAENVRDLVLIGSIRRPGFLELKPDWKGMEILSRIGIKALGDNDLLSLLRGELEAEGFRVHGAHRFVDDMLMPEAVLGQILAGEDVRADIALGFRVSQALGALDIGQAVVVQQGIVLALEAAEGTDALIERAGALQKKGRGAILVKTCKPQQDMDLDLPAIGPETVRKAHESGLAGIALHAGHAFIIDRDEVAKMADRYRMFVIGITPDLIDNENKS